MTIAHPARAGIIAGHVSNPLILPGKELVFAKATLLTGTAYKAGSVLGRIVAGAVEVAAKSGGNGSADGTFVIDATNPKRLGAKVGIYTLRVVEVHTTHDYTVELKDPDGFALGSYRLTGSGAAITIDNDIKGVLTDGATDFSAGHGFDITVSAGSSKLKIALAAAEDGSADPMAILCEDVDASLADKNCAVAVEGYFNETALIFGTGHTADTVRLPLRKLGMHITTMRYSG